MKKKSIVVVCFTFLTVFSLGIIHLLNSLNILTTPYLYEILESFILTSLVIIVTFTLKENIKRQEMILSIDDYSQKLNKVLISQSQNHLFYRGNVIDGGKILTKEVCLTINSDRCSIWLYNNDKTSIICQQLYIKSEDNWISGSELLKKDYTDYFNHLDLDPIIIANYADEHPATKCFTDSYLIPLGIKSMLDVPIIYKGEVIGVICIENLTKRNWTPVEVNFTQLISSLYSFAYSVKETYKISNELMEFDKFVDSSVLVSKADKNGRITYVNEKFEKVSGWKLNEVYGKDHKIVNSGFHSKEFWNNMYDTVINKKSIWNDIVTNRDKNGELYWVDSYIKANFDSSGDLEGFISIRYDISDIVRNAKEIEKKNTYLEHSAKIIRHDMHSGINTYIPRGISSLERRLNNEDVERLKLESPLKMLKEGLKHTQKVYKGVYEFTNLVKKDAVLNKTMCNLKDILKDYLSSTAYGSQVIIEDLPSVDINESLFCTAIDNLIRNGLKYNDSETKFVKIYYEKNTLYIQDNGRGLTQEEFNRLSQPYTRKEGQKETGTGLGLNICVAILKEHGFDISCEKNKIGTKIKIKLK